MAKDQFEAQNLIDKALNEAGLPCLDPCAEINEMTARGARIMIDTDRG